MRAAECRGEHSQVQRDANMHAQHPQLALCCVSVCVCARPKQHQCNGAPLGRAGKAAELQSGRVGELAGWRDRD